MKRQNFKNGTFSYDSNLFQFCLSFFFLFHGETMIQIDGHTEILGFWQCEDPMTL